MGYLDRYFQAINGSNIGSPLQTYSDQQAQQDEYDRLIESSSGGVRGYFERKEAEAGLASGSLTEGADDTYARISREQYDDQVARFQPFEDMNYANVLDPERAGELRGQALDISTDSVNNAYDRADNRMETYLSRSGTKRTARESEVGDRRNAVAKSALLTKSRNDTRGMIESRELDALSS